MTSALKAGLSYFAAVFAAGFLFGVVRTLLIAPRTGELAAVALELPLILAVSWVACGWAVRRHDVARESGARLVMAVTSFILLMAAELAVSTLIAGRSLDQHFALYRTAPVLLGLCGQLVYAALPLIRLR
ncbi:MAG: hypothetical protein H6887_02260 [Hoeflea sp.]|nr:hypothetical protein [Hoeflea sp.]